MADVSKELRAAMKPTVYNVTVDTSEDSQALPAGTKRFTIQCRTAVDLKLAYVSTETASNYITIKSGSSYTEENIHANNITLYLLAGSSVVAEIVVWA